MPQIIVTSGHGDEQTMTLRERVSASDFESERFAANLLERLGWAVVDATEAESERTRPITGKRRSAKEREQHLEPVGS